MSVMYTNEAICRKTQAKICDYVDNALSARDMWEVERHLTDCQECSQLTQRTRETVELLHSAIPLDPSKDFMANLHARLDTLGPVPARRTPAAAVREWLFDLRQQLNARPIPALSLGMASFIVAAVLFTGRPSPVAPPIPLASERVSQEALDRHVAVTASDPFDDPVAAKLEAESTGSDSVARSGTD